MTIAEYIGQGNFIEAKNPFERDLNGYRCHIALFKEEGDDDYSVICLNLKGVVSCGTSKENCIKTISEAVKGAIEYYKSEDKEIPWLPIGGYEIPNHEVELRWILVNA